MATNVFFRNYDYVNEQELIDDLVIESIQIYGIDVYYITRSLTATDEILNEDDLSVFDNAYEMDMYIKSVDGFEGEGDFLSRFGLQIRDQVTLTVARRTFEKFATRTQPSLIRPREGDIIWFPFNEKFFKIMFVEHESVFYQSGALQVFDLRCELFEYSNERFDTGYQYIDNYFAEKSQTVSSLELLGNRDPISKNLDFELEGNDFIDFSEIDPFSETITSITNYAITADTDNVTADTIEYTADKV